LTNNNLLEITTLFERTSRNGRTYLTGRLGQAKMVILPGDKTADGQPTWRVMIGQPTPASAAIKPQQRSGRPAARKPAAPRTSGPPLRNDPLDDLWRDGGAP
jgi:hypothetical protein